MVIKEQRMLPNIGDTMLDVAETVPKPALKLRADWIRRALAQEDRFIHPINTFHLATKRDPPGTTEAPAKAAIGR